MTRIQYLTLILSLLLVGGTAIDLTKWELFAENTKELSARNTRMRRVLASGGNNNGFPIQYLNQATQNWVTDGSGTHVRVDPPYEYYSNIQRTFFKRTITSTNPSWSSLSNIFPHEFCPYNNLIWYIGHPDTSAGKFVKRYNHFLQATVPQTVTPTKGEKVAVSPNGVAWVINENGLVGTHDGDIFWPSLPPIQANHIAFGITDVPHIVTKETTTGGFVIKRRISSAPFWETIPGIGGVFIMLDGDNNLYVVTNDNKVYRQRGVKSSFCPMCRANCATSDCTSYEGLCSAAGNQCLNCVPGKYAVDAPLRCLNCPSNCKDCSNSTTCTACPANQYLTPNGTCIASCPFPLQNSTESGQLTCRGPCADEGADEYYYPQDESCRSSCDNPIPISNELYQSCFACPDNCEECSSSTECTKCASSYFKSPLGTCDPCPENCLTCSNATNCMQCDFSYFLSPVGTCLSSCELPLVDDDDEEGNLYCKGPCTEDPDKTYYYPSNHTCQGSCGVPIPSQEEFYESCEPCPDNCETCSSTDTCTQCKTDYFLTPNGTCVSSCELPLIQDSGSGLDRCKGPCENNPSGSFFVAANGTCIPSCLYPMTPYTEFGVNYCKRPCTNDPTLPFYYPASGTCKAICEAKYSSQSPYYFSCAPCPNHCAECLFRNGVCDRCSLPYIRTSGGSCATSCSPGQIISPHPNGGKFCRDY